MRGYKGMDANMMCLDMQYQVGETYETEEPIILCNTGYHFCENLHQTFWYYPYGDSRYFEIEADGKILIGRSKCVCSKITIIREVPAIEVARCRYGVGCRIPAISSMNGNAWCDTGAGYDKKGDGESWQRHLGNNSNGSGRGDGFSDFGSGCHYSTYINDILVYI